MPNIVKQLKRISWLLNWKYCSLTNLRFCSWTPAEIWKFTWPLLLDKSGPDHAMSVVPMGTFKPDVNMIFYYPLKSLGRDWTFPFHYGCLHMCRHLNGLCIQSYLMHGSCLYSSQWYNKHTCLFGTARLRSLKASICMLYQSSTFLYWVKSNAYYLFFLNAFLWSSVACYLFLFVVSANIFDDSCTCSI